MFGLHTQLDELFPGEAGHAIGVRVEALDDGDPRPVPPSAFAFLLAC